jgi:GT2 family glycosyltransferase
MTPDATAPELSVVIPTFGTAARLRVTLSCLAAVTAPPFEVLVVDDSPAVEHDASAMHAVLAEADRHLLLRVLRSPQRGRAAARNTGAAAARARWLIFLDDDVLVGPGFLQAHAAAARPDRFLHGRLRELPTAKRFLHTLQGADYATVRQARVELEPPPGATTSTRREPHRRLVTNALERTVEAMDSGTMPDVAPWLGFIGANVSLDHAAWVQTGGFDEEFGRTWGCEDLEFGLRLHANGVCRALVPDALGIHLSHARPGRWEQHAQNLDRFVALHPHTSVYALRSLLGPNGTPEEYLRAVLEGNPVGDENPTGAESEQQPARVPR